jgi:hypothetical protein
MIDTSGLYEQHSQEREAYLPGKRLPQLKTTEMRYKTTGPIRRNCANVARLLQRAMVGAYPKEERGKCLAWKNH